MGSKGEKKSIKPSREIEKCCLCNKIIFRNAKFVGTDFEPCDSTRFSSFLRFGIKSSRKRFECAIHKNSPLIAE